MHISYSALSNLTGLIIMISAWLFVRHRLKSSGVTATHQVALMRNFFLSFGLFYLFITLPFIFIYTATSYYGLAMAIGFVIGHALLFVALTFTARITFAMMPRLASKERYVKIIGAVAVLWIIATTVTTMLFGTHPTYDYAAHITNYQEAPVVATTIALGAIVAWVPLGILFLINAVKVRHGQRIRSVLLGIGFLVLTAVGPLHGLAHSYGQFLVADFATIVSIIMIGAGVAYKINVDLTENQQPNRPVEASSNTV